MTTHYLITSTKQAIPVTARDEDDALSQAMAMGIGQQVVRVDVALSEDEFAARTTSAKVEFKKWYSACRACVRDQRLARSHRVGAACAEQMFWAEHKDAIVFRHGYAASPNGLARIAGPMGLYHAKREYWRRWNSLRYRGLRGREWHKQTLASLVALRAEMAVLVSYGQR